MSDAMFEKLSAVDLATIVALIIFISISIKFIEPLFKKLKNYIINKYKKEVKNEKIETIVYENRDKMKTYETNRLHDREQSFRIQKELVDSINQLSKKLDDMEAATNKRFEESRECENKRLRAELKDKISEHYRRCHARKKWSYMEKEVIEDLIAEYEAVGGTNSFVHEVVQEEMYTWELIGNPHNS